MRKWVLFALNRIFAGEQDFIEKMFRSIKAKILAAQLGLVFFIAVVLGLIAYFIMFRSLRNSHLQYLEYAATATGEKISLLITAKEQLLEKIANSESVANYARKRSENILVGYFGRFMSEFNVLSFINDEGVGEVELINGKIPAKVLCEAHTVLVERLKKNPNKVLNEYVAFCPDINGPSVEFGFFHKSFFDEFVGIVLGEVSVVELFKNIQESRIGKTGSVILLDSHGTILSCKDPNSLLQKLAVEGAGSIETMAGIKAVGSGFGRAKILGVDSYFVYAPAYKQSWAVMTVLPYEEFAAALNTLRGMVFTVSLSVLTAGSVLSWFLARNITGPILKLAKGTNLVAKGDFSHKIRITSRDEVGTLAESFNRMAEDLGRTTTSIVNLNREITERRKVEASLRKSEKRFEEVAENSGDWIWEVNAEGLYTYASPVVEKVLGYKPEEIVGKKYFYDFFAPDTKEKLKRATFEAFARRESFGGFINFNIHKNGSVVILETYGTPVVDDKGNFCGYRGADRDITERKRAEEAIKKLNKNLKLTVQKLNRSNKELQEFAYIAAHDLKTPLRAIATLAGWLLMDYGDKLDQEGKERLNLLVGRAKRIDKLVDSIMEYSEIEHVGQNKQQVDLNMVLSEVIRKIGPPGNIEVIVENKLPAIVCSKALVIRVFRNLLGNAVKYMDKPKGQIRIGCREDDDFWTFSVSDNGPGIEQKYFDKIFRIFQMLSTHDEVEAVGIGLSLTKKIVELYGGRIWVQSEPGQGSTFYFTLPMQEMRVKDELREANITC